MKKDFKKLRSIVCVIAYGAAIVLSGCRQDVKYFFYYPHSVLGAVQPSANWQEFNISPLQLEEKEYLVVTFDEDGRTLCQNDISAYHLCSPAAQAEYHQQLEDLRAIPDDQSNFPQFDSQYLEMTKTVEREPLPDLQIELVTESGETEIYEPRFYDGAEGQMLPFDFRECNYTVWNRAKLAAGVDRESAKYSIEEIYDHQRKCQESHAKVFVKMRVLSPTRMNVESIKLENYYSPFSVR